MAIVSEAREHYLINCMGLTKKQIKQMLPSEITAHCERVVKKEIEESDFFKPKKPDKSDKSNKSNKS